MNKIQQIIQLIRNMGLRYLLFRIFYILKTKTRFQELVFPVEPKNISIITLADWRNNLPAFYFYGKDIPELKKQKAFILENNYKEFIEGNFTFFSNIKLHLGKDYDWITNPLTGYKFNINQHWSHVQEYRTKAGDIKFVWEKARFSFLYDLIRYDFHYDVDCSKLVFNEINSFIAGNPVNKGPNYKCSQEISLRIFNWTFALYYFKDSEFLTEELFQKIINSIYWQIHHVFHNIHFSRIAVRNNHAITETLLLYISGFLFPFLPDVKKWSIKGKKWFEQEILFQIYEDGTYLQFSNNYHRVVIQLLTLGIRLADLNNDKLNPDIYKRAWSSLDFLFNSSDKFKGYLPNYGSNDGALLFKFNNEEFRDYRPQLQALAYLINAQNVINYPDFECEDLYWLGLGTLKTKLKNSFLIKNVFQYPLGGFYFARERESLTYIRCGNHKVRPGHADNLHLDIWHNGINYFRDNGSYLYNTESRFLNFFMGTRSHNTIMLNDFNQMLKGSRFIWYFWSQAKNAVLKEYEDRFVFEGSIEAFKYLNRKIVHNRKVIKFKGHAKWIIEDIIIGTNKYKLNQLWHPDPKELNNILIKSKDSSGMQLEKKKEKGWYSSHYGVKEETEYWSFSTSESGITTEIEIT